jgi:hypothetical protein
LIPNICQITAIICMIRSGSISFGASARFTPFGLPVVPEV